MASTHGYGGGYVYMTCSGEREREREKMKNAITVVENDCHTISLMPHFDNVYMLSMLLCARVNVKLKTS